MGFSVREGHFDSSEETYEISRNSESKLTLKKF